MKRFLIVAALVAGLAMPAWGQDFDAGMAAYDRGNYAAAVEEWRPLALAVPVHDTEVVLGEGEPLLGGQAGPRDCLAIVLRDATAVAIHDAEVVLGSGVSLARPPGGTTRRLRRRPAARHGLWRI